MCDLIWLASDCGRIVSSSTVIAVQFDNRNVLTAIERAARGRAGSRRFGWLAMCAAVCAGVARAQREPGAPEAAAGCAVCGTLIFIPIAILVLNIALLVWVARDAKARGMDSAILWMLLVFFTSVIGLVIYILARPQGNLIRCARCGNQRLQASAACPHCGNA